MGNFEFIAGLGYGWVFVIDLACIIAGGIIGTIIITKVLRRMFRKSKNIDDAIVTFLVNAAKVLCIVIILTLLLQRLGVQMPTIVAVLGAAGAAIALALRDSLANIAGGVMIIVTHPFRQGDLISIGNDRGRVEHIDLFLTTLRTLDYRTITVPNGIINTSVVYNETNRDIRRVDCEFSISYESDIEKAKEILHNICLDGDLILDDPEPMIGVTGHKDSGITIECLAYCRQDDQWDTRYYLYETAKTAFDEAGIEIPYPHLNISVVKRR